MGPVLIIECDLNVREDRFYLKFYYSHSEIINLTQQQITKNGLVVTYFRPG